MDRKTFLQLLSGGALAFAARASRVQAAQPRKHWTWMRGPTDDLDRWRARFDRIREAGLQAVLLGGGPEDLALLTPLARAAGLEVHAWTVIMMRGGMEAEHPEWYAVNRNGVSTVEKPPYVDYYKFMCPSREPVRAYLAERIAEVARQEGIVSVHLDYIRYPDVILPVSLWPKYNLVQDKEYPDFDYCYCEVCRAAFEAETGLDPLALEDPPAHAAWLQYRYDGITRVVNELADVAHGHGKQITAAVFPTPDIARRLVRQDWVNWNLDAVLPMVYHSFYEEPVSWVGQATREGVEALDGRFPLYSGLYVPELNPQELAQAAALALENGAEGVVLFEGWGPTEEHWAQLGKVLHG